MKLDENDKIIGVESARKIKTSSWVQSLESALDLCQKK